MKRIFSLLILSISVCLSLLLPVASASTNDYDLLGFTNVEHEIAINPCMDSNVLQERFGNEALHIQQNELNKWPINLCQNLDVSQQLLTWNYYHTTLLANTERPAVVANEITKHHNSLRACNDIACLKRRLPRMTEWAYFNIDRLPVFTDSESAKQSQAVLAGDPVAHPTLALRNLPLTLTGLSERCEGTSINDLNFFTVNFSVQGRPLVLATCKKSDSNSNKEQNIWLLERLESNQNTTLAFTGEGSGASGWREVLVERGNSRLYYFTNSRTIYPTLYSRRSTGAGEEMIIYDFSEPIQQYTRSVELQIEYDALGRAHAFMQLD